MSDEPTPFVHLAAWVNVDGDPELVTGMHMVVIDSETGTATIANGEGRVIWSGAEGRLVDGGAVDDEPTVKERRVTEVVFIEVGSLDPDVDVDAPPRRRFRLKLDAHGDSLGDLEELLERLADDVGSGDLAPSDRTSGGAPSAGWTVTLTEDETVTPTSYRAALEAWRATHR